MFLLQLKEDVLQYWKYMYSCIVAVQLKILVSGFPQRYFVFKSPDKVRVLVQCATTTYLYVYIMPIKYILGGWVGRLCWVASSAWVSYYFGIQ